MVVLVDILGVKPIGDNRYESVQNPQRMGNQANISFGGFTLGIAANVAHQGIPDNYRMYSMSGNFLGGALTDRKLFCTSKELRRTRTFITRSIEAYQKQDNGSDRICLVSVVDFHVIESQSFMTYSATPKLEYTSVQDSPHIDDCRRKLVAEGTIDQALSDTHAKLFSALTDVFDVKYPPESVCGQNLQGMAKGVKTTQHHLPIAARTAADWVKCKSKIPTAAQQAYCLAFMMDASISFLPLTLDSLPLNAAGACSTLDFALRLLTPDLDLNQWHLREWKTFAGRAARTYSEAGLWDDHGNMVASMTQTSILRPPPTKAKI
ncbi:hypothetical protein MBLNU457_g2968t1 [Dothideomycetes sp. NU457]